MHSRPVPERPNLRLAHPPGRHTATPGDPEAGASPFPLLERGPQEQAIVDLLAAAAQGRGGAVLVEAAAGLGKTQLVRLAAAQGGRSGLRVLTATGGRFEQAHPWGAARALLDLAVAGLPAAERRRLGGGGLVPSLIGDAGGARAVAHSEDEVLRVAHRLFAVIESMAVRGPLVICVDDLHWLDPPSLRFVLYLLQRVHEVPVALVLAARPGEDTAARPLLDHVAAHPSARRLTLAPLSRDAVAELFGGALAGAADPDAVVDRAREVTAGNPFFLARLLDQAAAEAGAGRPVTPERLERLALPSLASVVAVRIADAAPLAPAVSGAVAVLGEEATVHRIAGLTGLTERKAGEVADALMRAGLLEPGEPLRFIHPLVAAAVHDALSPARAADDHARAARLLDADGVAPGAVAAHLLFAPRRADGWTVARLGDAGGRALRSGAAPAAVRFFERALDEPPSRHERPGLLVELARAQAAAGDDRAGETFTAALEELSEPVPRAEVLREHARWLFTTGRGRDAARTFLLARSELEGVEFTGKLDAELRAAYLGVAHFDVDLRPLVDREFQELLDATELGRSGSERMLLAQMAFQQTFAAAPRDRVRRLCDRAWGGAALLDDEGADGDAWTLVAGALYWTGDLERALELVDAARQDAVRTGSPLGQATVAWCSAPPLLHRGEVTRALAQAEVALRARAIGWARHLGSLHRVHARCLIEQGDLAGAASTLAAVLEDPMLRHSGESALLLEARGRLKLLDGDAAGALADFHASRERGTHVELPTVLPWRSSAALAQHALGDREAALELLDEELAQAERSGVDRALSTALRARGIVLGGDEGLASLEAAVRVLGDEHPRLERTHALVDLGVALRRAGRRREAEPPLRAALAAAQAGGATVAASRARTELGILRARAPRAGQAALDVLTPSERRVAELAAGGKINRDIAQELFVTPKTVEVHLSAVYRKLGISSRRGLEHALTP